MEEIWRDIPGLDGKYLISNLGNVKSVDRFDTRGVFHKGMMMKKSMIHGRQHIIVPVDRKSKCFTIAKCIVLAFPEICGKWYEGCDIHHKDFERTNDRADNLVVLSKEEHKAIHHHKKEKVDKWANWKRMYLS